MRYWSNHHFMWRCFLETYGRLGISFFKKANIYDISEIILINIYLLKICLILHTSKIRNATSHISRRCNNLIRIEGGGGNNVCRITSKWRPEILTEIEYLGFQNYNVFIYFFGSPLSWNSSFFCPISFRY